MNASFSDLGNQNNNNNCPHRAPSSFNPSAETLASGKEKSDSAEGGTDALDRLLL